MTGALPYSGSPPLVRGIFSRRQPDTHSGRLTPACAGNIIASAFDDACIQAHPRMRGEYRFNRRYLMQDTGSPPHTRGICARSGHEGYDGRLTPAYAGNMMSDEVYVTFEKAHPRIRGEYRFTS